MNLFILSIIWKKISFENGNIGYLKLMEVKDNTTQIFTKESLSMTFFLKEDQIILRMDLLVI